MSMKSFLLLVLVFLLSCHLKCEARSTPSPTLLPAQVWSELEVNLTAAEVWAMYSSPDIPKLFVKLMPFLFQRIDVLQGNGTQGTIVNVTLQPTNPGPLTWQEQFVTIDHTTRTKVVRQIKGGYLNIGFALFENIYQITPKGHRSCVIRSTSSFIINKGSESGASLISASWKGPYAAVDYIRAHQAK